MVSRSITDAATACQLPERPEQIEPADDNNRQTYDTDKSLFVSDKSAIHEERLRRAWPDNK